jgi:hypothetical protein
MPSGGGPIYGRSVIEYQPWRILVADFILSDIINIGRYGGFFRHNLLLRHHQTDLGGCSYTILEFGIRPNTTLQNQLVRWGLPTNVRLLTQSISQWSSYSFNLWIICNFVFQYATVCDFAALYFLILQGLQTLHYVDLKWSICLFYFLIFKKSQ